LSLRLERSGGALVGALAAVTLAVVMLALFPTVAEAESASSVVVRPGDSLWSISQERLGPNAAPQRIANGAQQIYTLNRERIGADPNLILVGQELLIPPAMSERSAGAPPERKTHESGPRDRVAKSTMGKAPRTTPNGPDVEGGKASKTVAEKEAEQPTILPGPAAAATVPAVRAVASNDAQPPSVASFLSTVRAEFTSAASAVTGSFFEVSADAHAEGRRLLGLGVLVLTLLVAALVAWKLPMRRTTRRDAERWGASSGYYGYYGEASRAARFAPHPVPLRDEQDARRETSGVLGQRAVLLASSDVSFASSVIRKPHAAEGGGRTPKAKAVPRNGLALGAHNPKVRRAPRRAHAWMRARKLRPQRLASRRLRPHSPSGKRRR
jgi:hypothetical protein